MSAAAARRRFFGFRAYVSYQVRITVGLRRCVGQDRDSSVAHSRVVLLSS